VGTDIGPTRSSAFGCDIPEPDGKVRSSSLTSDGLLAYGSDAPGEILPRAAAAAALRGNSSRGHSSGGKPTCAGICGKNGG